MRIRHRQFGRVAAGILLNRDQRRYSSAFGVNAPPTMSGTLGSNHDHIYVGRRDDRLEMNSEAVGDTENFPGMQIRFDGLLVNLSLRLIWREHVDPVGALGSLIGGYNDHAVGTRLLGAGAVWVKTDTDL